MNFPLNHPGWIAIGIVLIVIGIWLVRWANRNSMTAAIADATAEAAFKSIRNRAAPEMPSAIKTRLDDVASAQSTAGKAKKIAGYGFRHAMSQLFGVIGFVTIVAGLLLAVLGAFYG